MHEYLHPSTLQTAVTNALQAAHSNSHGHGGLRGFAPRGGRPFLGLPREPQLSAGKDGTINPDKTCRYCKDTGHEMENCVHLQRKKGSPSSSSGRTGVKLKAPAPGGCRGQQKLTQPFLFHLHCSMMSCSVL